MFRLIFTIALKLTCGFTVCGASSIYDFTFESIDGKSASIEDYKGEFILIVFVASKSGYTGQYAGLQ